MTKVIKIHGPVCYYFERSPNKRSSFLKDAINYIRHENKRGVISFSFASGQDALVNDLSLIDNILLDTQKVDQLDHHQSNMMDLIQDHQNPFLEPLIRHIPSEKVMASQLNKSQAQLFSILKATLRSTEYLCVQVQETDLSIEHKQLIKKILLHEIMHEQRKVYLCSDHGADFWSDIIGHYITRNDKMEFIKDKNHLSELAVTHVNIEVDRANSLLKEVHEKVEKEETNKVYDFSLKKKVA